MQKDPLAVCASIMESLALPYCVIGGFAVACHGVPRQTGDVDVMVILDGDPADVVDGLKKAGYQTSHAKSDILDPLGDVITIHTAFPIQIIAAKYQYQYDTVQNAIIVPYAEKGLRVAAAPDLVLLKLKGGSPRDMDDAESIITVQGPSLDIPVLMERAKQIRVDRRLRMLLERVECAD